MVCQSQDQNKPLSLKNQIIQGIQKPSYLRPSVENIPDELKNISQWVAWEWTRREDRWIKLPLNAKNLRNAKINDSTTWSSFHQAFNALDGTTGEVGLGFVFTPDDPFLGIDLDNCIDEFGILKDWGQEIVNHFRSYSEVSPSRTGVKIFIKANKPDWFKRCKIPYAAGEIEFYDHGRYFTVTGRKLPGSPGTVEDRQTEFEDLCEILSRDESQEVEIDDTPETGEKLPGKQSTGTVVEDPNLPGAEDLSGIEKALGRFKNLKPFSREQEILESCRKHYGEKFNKLYDQGDINQPEYGGDRSRADYQLVSWLAWFSDEDPEIIDSLFRKSKLIREKWDEKRGEVTYGEGTIYKVLEDQKQKKQKETRAGGNRTSKAPKPLTQSPSPQAVATGLITSCLKNVRPKPVRWLIPQFVPLGKLSAFVGDGGRGKSTITLAMAADLSQGRGMFGLSYPADEVIQGDTLLISCEDDFEDTIVPRLISMRADLSRIHSLEGVVKGDKKGRFTLEDFEVLKEYLQGNQQVRLVIIDPAGAYIGNKDDHRDSELRQLLGPLTEVAATQNVAIILVKHINKSTTSSAIHRTTGSVAWGNAVRSVLMFAPHPEIDELTCIAVAKTNLSKYPKTLGYRLEPIPVQESLKLLQNEDLGDLGDEDRLKLAEQLFRPAWEAVENVSADDLMATRKKGEETKNSKPQQCEAWIQDFLKEFARTSNEIVTAGKKAGFNFDHVKNAKANLVKREILSNHKIGQIWWSGLGPRADWKFGPDPSQN